MKQHYYLASPLGFDRKWTTPIELYTYLYYTPSERHRLIREVTMANTNSRRTVIITHPCSSQVRIAPHQPDEAFVRQLEFLIRQEIEEWESHMR